MQSTWYIRGGRVVDPLSGSEKESDLFIRDGRLAAVPAQVPSTATVIDAGGLVVVPGFWDLHTHLREPGNEDAETIETGSRAAAHGGFTTVVAMPNTNPPLDTPERVAYVQEQGRKAGLVRVLVAACITRGRKGLEPAALGDLAQAGAVAFTDDGSTVPDEAVMARAMQTAAELGRPVMDHALDPVLAGRGVIREGPGAARFSLAGIPTEAEIRIVERDIELSRRTGCSLHIQHVSVKASAALIADARKRGVGAVSGEATPHHLALTEADIRRENTSFKVNPPLGSEEDRRAIIAAVVDGSLTALATDHAPHKAAEKRRDFNNAPFGAIGLETAIGVTYSLLVKGGRMSLMEWVKRWTEGPASVLRRPFHGLSEGAPADLAILDLDTEWTVAAADLLSKSRNTPFEGRRVTGRAVYTFCNGMLTWKAR